MHLSSMYSYFINTTHALFFQRSISRCQFVFPNVIMYRDLYLFPDGYFLCFIPVCCHVQKPANHYLLPMGYFMCFIAKCCHAQKRVKHVFVSNGIFHVFNSQMLPCTDICKPCICFLWDISCAFPCNMYSDEHHFISNGNYIIETEKYEMRDSTPFFIHQSDHCDTVWLGLRPQSLWR